jgi:hypothetical protein
MLNWLGNLHGASHAWKVEDLDDRDAVGDPKIFVLKHFRQDELRKRVGEYVAGSFVNALDIGAPAISLLDVSSEFLEDLLQLKGSPRENRAPQLLSTATPGRHVGVEWVDADDLGNNNYLLDRLANPEQVGQVIGADALLLNLDRDGWNLFIRPRKKGSNATNRLELIPYDWDHCFAGQGFSDAELEPLYSIWNVFRAECLRERILGGGDFTSIRERVEDWAGAEARIRGLVEWMPAEWAVPDSWKAGLVKFMSERIETTLRELKNPSGQARIFPNWQSSAI